MALKNNNGGVVRWMGVRRLRRERLRRLSASSEELWFEGVGAKGRPITVYLTLDPNGRSYCTCREERSDYMNTARTPAGLLCRHLAAAAVQSGHEELLLRFLLGVSPVCNTAKAGAFLGS